MLMSNLDLHTVWACSIDYVLFISICRTWFNFHEEFFFLFLLPPIILYPFLQFFSIVIVDFFNGKKGLLTLLILIHKHPYWSISFRILNLYSLTSIYSIRIQLISGKYFTTAKFFVYLRYFLKSLHWFTETILCELWGYCNFRHSWDVHCFCCNRGSCVSN